MSVLTKIIESHYKPLIRKEKKSDFNFTYYIDCFDLIDILKGIKRFTEDNENIERVSDIRTLTYNLLLDNWVGAINLLPPHQSEFFDSLNYDFGIRDAHITNNDLDGLVNQISDKTEKKQTFSTLKNPKQFKIFIKTIVKKSIHHFNLFGLWRENNWQKRLQLLIDKKILNIIDYNLTDYLKLVNTENFRKIKLAMDECRKLESVRNRSNYNDSLALTYLLNKKQDKEIPILLDSRGFYKKVIQKANLEKSFEYNLITSKKQSKLRTSIIRDNTYFIIKSIFDCPKEKLKAIEKNFPKYFEIFENSKEDVTSIDTILEENNIGNFFSQDDSLKEMYISNKNEFEDYLENEFFNKVWLSCYHVKDFNSFIEKHFEYQKIENINHIEAIKEYKKTFFETYESVKKESKIFSILTQIWADLNATDAINYIKIGPEDDAFQAIMLFGAFRFSLPYENENLEDAEIIINELLFEKGFLGNSVGRNHAINETIKYLFEGMAQNKLHSLSIGITILWSLERYKSINRLFAEFHSIREYPHFTLALIHCASLLKEASMEINRKKVSEILECVESKIDSKNYKYLIGKAYVYYLMWNGISKTSFSSSLCVTDNNSKFFSTSFDAVTEAINFLKTTDYQENNSQLLLLVYGLNLKIYLVVEGGNDYEMQKIEQDLSLFIRCPEYKGFWQGRYDDTIARYYLRVAIKYFLNNNENSFHLYLKNAKERMAIALHKTFQEKQKTTDFEIQIAKIEQKFNDGSLRDFLIQCQNV